MGKIEVGTIREYDGKRALGRFRSPGCPGGLPERKTIAQLASSRQVHPQFVTKGKQKAITELPILFERGKHSGSIGMVAAVARGLGQWPERAGPIAAQCVPPLPCSLPPEMACSAPDKGHRLPVPGAGGRLQPPHDLLRSTRVLAGQGAAVPLFNSILQ